MTITLDDAIGRKRIKLMLFGISVGFLCIAMLIGVPFALWLLAQRNVQAATDKKEELTQLTMVETETPKIDLPKGSISVRVIRGDMSHNLANQPVDMRAGNTTRTVNTDAEGRAQFEHPSDPVNFPTS